MVQRKALGGAFMRLLRHSRWPIRCPCVCIPTTPTIALPDHSEPWEELSAFIRSPLRKCLQEAKKRGPATCQNTPRKNRPLLPHLLLQADLYQEPIVRDTLGPFRPSTNLLSSSAISDIPFTAENQGATNLPLQRLISFCKECEL